MTQLILKNVTKKFGGLVAVNQLDMTVGKGQVYGVIGPNGAGKTTVFNCITGIYKPDGGSINWCGEDITGLPPHKMVSKGIARTFQTIRLFGQMSVAENVMSGRHHKMKQGWWNGIIHTPMFKIDEKENWLKVKEILKDLELESFAFRPANSLSYGFQRKVEIARALATEPKLMILDEPAAGLNESETLQLVETILQIRKRGITILLIEHDMDMVMSISDYLTVLNFGQKIAEGNPSDVQSNSDVILAYLGTDDHEEDYSDKLNDKSDRSSSAK